MLTRGEYPKVELIEKDGASLEYQKNSKMSLNRHLLKEGDSLESNANEIFQYNCHNCEEKFASIEDMTSHSCCDQEKIIYLECKMCANIFTGPKNSEELCNNCRHLPILDHSIFSTDILEKNNEKENEETYPSSSTTNYNLHKTESYISKNTSASSKKCRKQKFEVEVDDDDAVIKELTCLQCQKSFRSPASLALHKKTHSQNPKYECEICSKKFCISDYYARHMRVHTKEKPYTCERCGKSFSQPNTLTQHTRIHTGEKPFQCDFCDKKFGVRDYLNKHLRIHTGIKPYSCDFCCEGFSQRSAIKRHMKSHSICNSAQWDK